MSREILEPRTLTKRDLDERIGRVAAELFGDSAVDASSDWAPVPIKPAELVRRMARYVVYN